MKYRKIVLTEGTIGLLKDRLNKLMLAGISIEENAWGNVNPTRKDIDFSFCVSRVYKSQQVKVERNEWINNEVTIVIPSHYNYLGNTVFRIGDTFHLGNDVIIVQSDKTKSSTGENSITKITLLSRSLQNEAAWAAYIKSEEYDKEMEEYYAEYLDREMVTFEDY